MTRTKKPSKISVLNWMGTLLLCSIPGVNIIAIICFLIFAKSPSKRSFALAVLLWAVIGIVAVIALLAAFPAEATALAELLRTIAAMPASSVAVIG